MRYNFTAVYVDGEDGWIVGYLEELPGIYGQGRTIDEARVSLRGALALALACNRRDGQNAFSDARVIQRERLTV